MPFPDYDEDVEEFFHLAVQDCWMDSSYQPSESARMLTDDKFISQASLGQVRTMLTYCVRGERFCDGHWQEILKGGQLVVLLRRLRVIREQM
jgi:hypothetical protein